MTHASRVLTVTDANLKNNHLYVTAARDLFPADVFGGSNKAQAAPPDVTPPIR